MGNWKSACWGDSEEQKTEMKMDNNEPVNLQGADSKGKGMMKKNGSSGALATDDSSVINFKIIAYLWISSI